MQKNLQDGHDSKFDAQESEEATIHPIIRLESLN